MAFDVFWACYMLFICNERRLKEINLEQKLSEEHKEVKGSGHMPCSHHKQTWTKRSQPPAEAVKPMNACSHHEDYWERPEAARLHPLMTRRLRMSFQFSCPRLNWSNATHANPKSYKYILEWCFLGETIRLKVRTPKERWQTDSPTSFHYSTYFSYWL